MFLLFHLYPKVLRCVWILCRYGSVDFIGTHITNLSYLLCKPYDGFDSHNRIHTQSDFSGSMSDDETLRRFLCPTVES